MGVRQANVLYSDTLYEIEQTEPVKGMVIHCGENGKHYVGTIYRDEASPYHEKLVWFQKDDGILVPSIPKPLPVEIITDPNFATPADWTFGAGWSMSNNKATCTGSQVSASDLTNKGSNVSVNGTTYNVTVTANQINTGSVTPYVGTVAGTAISVASTVKQQIIATVNNASFSLKASDDFVGQLTLFSVSAEN